MAEDENLALVIDYMTRIARGDVEGALALCHDDIAFRGPDGSTTGKDGLRALFAQIAPLLVNPMEQEIVGTTCQGNRVAIEAQASTMLANGREYANIYHFLFEVEGGMICAAREYCDTTRGAAFAA